MSDKLKVGFVWQGITGVYGRWDDGLREAMRLLEEKYDVTYHEPQEKLDHVDIILYWEAPITYAGLYKDNYQRIRTYNKPKILLFAGGQIRKEWCDGFDMFLVESEINEREFSEIGLPWKRAFGVNVNKMKPEKQPIIWDACFPGTCAGWKRQPLLARACGSKAVFCGRDQKEDMQPFVLARSLGATIFPEISYEAVNVIYNASVACVNTSEYWGGGQRVTLEAMAAGTPVIVMSDSPKNMEYVQESGFGLIVAPSEEAIRKAIDEVREWTPEQRLKGREYVLSKWTSQHYADNIDEAIKEVLEKYAK